MVSEFIINVVHAFNNVRSNVWSVILIIVGVTLVMYGHDAVGGSLVTGAFAVFRSSNTDTAPVPPNAAMPPPKPIPPIKPVAPVPVVIMADNTKVSPRRETIKEKLNENL